jgi:hypothetical protein
MLTIPFPRGIQADTSCTIIYIPANVVDILQSVFNRLSAYNLDDLQPLKTLLVSLTNTLERLTLDSTLIRLGL